MPDMPKIMHTCPCGYSLETAARFLKQSAISEMMLGHIESMHLEQVDPDANL
jgi:hypothetical protein